MSKGIRTFFLISSEKLGKGNIDHMEYDSYLRSSLSNYLRSVKKLMKRWNEIVLIYIYIKKTCSRRAIRITQVILKYQEVLLEWYAQSYLLSRFPNTEWVMAYNLIVGIGHFQTFSRTDTRFSLSFLQSWQ